MNTKQINELIQPSVADATSTAADLVEKLVAAEEWGEVLVEGRQKHGSAFIAFLLAPFVRARHVHQLLELFDEAYVLKERNEEQARDALVQYNTWDEVRIAANRDLGVEELLVWDEDELWAALDDRYAFISTYEGCFVFDRHVLNPEAQ